MNFMPPPLRCLSIFGLSLALAACDTPPTVVDQHFGLAVQRAQAQQSLLAPGTSPSAPGHCPPERPAHNCPTRHMQPHDGMGMGMGMGRGAGTHSSPMAHDKLSTSPDTDGASALGAVTRYQQSFQTPPTPTPVFNIGLGAVRAP